ncbi:hypothetical protein GF312_17485 [Candidatus Poribacteria bacterium]|nr:hypothetical protein [Candidatus Poribacteria bacterium]
MDWEDEDELRFIADEMLGKLAKWLRAIGYDTVYFTGVGDEALVKQALKEDRLILTKDSNLVKRKMVRNSFLVEGDDPKEQFKQVVQEMNLDVKSNFFTRCLVCNTELVFIEKEEAWGKVPVYTYMTHDVFYECEECNRIYWSGTHRDNMLELLNDIVG